MLEGFEQRKDKLKQERNQGFEYSSMANPYNPRGYDDMNQIRHFPRPQIRNQGRQNRPRQNQRPRSQQQFRETMPFDPRMMMMPPQFQMAARMPMMPMGMPRGGFPMQFMPPQGPNLMPPNMMPMIPQNIMQHPSMMNMPDQMMAGPQMPMTIPGPIQPPIRLPSEMEELGNMIYSKLESLHHNE